MKLIHRKEQRGNDGSVIYVQNEYAIERIIIGRGGKSNIILKGHKVSLEHCIVTFNGDYLSLADNGSVYGTSVNGDLATRATLSSGDNFQVGDANFEVEQSSNGWTITESQIEEAENSGTESVVERTEKALSLSLAMPRLQTLSLLGLFFVLALFLLYPMQLKQWSAWSTGPMTGNHAMIAKDCQACHTDPYSTINDKACLACHTLTDHVPHNIKLAHEINSGKNCVDCHQEHWGPERLIHKTSGQCVECHGDIKSLVNESEMRAVHSFKNHPEFAVTLQRIPGQSKENRVSLDQKEALQDHSNVSLNHALHLKSIRGPEGLETLTCASCHIHNSDLKSFKPISFEDNCQRCHSLEFDKRLPGIQVPHGNADFVYPSLYAAYATLTLDKGSEEVPSNNTIRSRPGEAMPSVQRQATSGEDFSKKNVEREARSAERELFTRTGCKLCHLVDEIVPAGDFVSKALFQVRDPEILDSWMPGAKFDHGAHEEISCNDCHSGVAKSEKTEDVLMPNVRKCQDCHGDPNGDKPVESNCTTCHSYHDSKPVELSRKRDVSAIIRDLSK